MELLRISLEKPWRLSVRLPLPSPIKSLVDKVIRLLCQLHGLRDLQQCFQHFLALPADGRAFVEQRLNMRFNLAFAIQIAVGKLAFWARWLHRNTPDATKLAPVGFRSLMTEIAEGSDRI